MRTHLYEILMTQYVNVKNNYQIIENVFTIKECDEIIDTANKYTYDVSDEMIDDKPLYQIDVYYIEYYNILCKKKLWNKILPVYANVIRPLILPDLYLDFVFLRKYNPYERNDLSLHTDENEMTVNAMLSDPFDYQGGEFYIFDKEITKNNMEYYENVMMDDENEKNKFIASFDKLPVLKLNKGSIIVYNGDEHIHGVLPLTSGSRYIISFFFENKENYMRRDRSSGEFSASLSKIQSLLATFGRTGIRKDM